MKIEIYHQSYNLQAEENEEYLNELAAYVDAKMRAVAKSTQTVDTVRIAVLAALNIADELHSQPAAGGSARASAAGNADAIREAREEAREEAVRETTDRLRAGHEIERRAEREKTASLRRQVEDCVKIVDKAMAASGSGT